MADEDRPRADPSVGHRSQVGQLALEVADRLVGGLAVDVGFGRQVPHPAPDAAADADLDEPVDHLVEEADRARLEERRRARLEHLDRGQLRRQPLLGRRVDGVQPAQPDEHVLLERRVVGDVAAGERLAGDVDVRVDQPGRDDEPLTAGAHGIGMLRREVGRLADIDDPVAVDDDRAVADDVARGVHRHDVGTGDQRFGHTANLDVRLPGWRFVGWVRRASKSARSGWER